MLIVGDCKNKNIFIRLSKLWCASTVWFWEF